MGRELLTSALESLYEIDFDESKLAYNEHKKPFLKDNKDIFFNISHSNKVVILAVSDVEIGIDVEDIYNFSEPMIERVFSVNEREFAKSCENKDQYFTSLWTLKESYLKCLGSGLSLPLTGISFSLKSDNYPTQFKKNNTYFFQDRIGNESVFSICLKLR